MKNLEIAWIISKIADLAELKGENPYKVMAYRNAAENIKKLDVDITELYKKNELLSIPGVGQNIAAKIEEIIETGKSKYYEELKKEAPRDYEKILRIPGLGSSRLRMILQQLPIKDINDLKKAAKAKKIRKLPGLGPKTEQAILTNVKIQENKKNLKPLIFALPVAEEIVNLLNKLDFVEKGVIVGSIRRKKEMIKNINLLIQTTSPERVAKIIKKMPGVEDVSSEGDVITVDMVMGIRAFIHLTRNDFYTKLQHFTGSKAHNIKLKQIAQQRGFELSETGLFKEHTKIVVEAEEDVYTKLGLQYIPPELREDRGEIEAALEHDLPELITLQDIKGDLHIHTNWSDGLNNIEEIAEQARKMGYNYIAITDHSKSLKIANGLTEDELIKQRNYIKKLNKNFKGIEILAGIEVDIRKDGSLDYSDDILKKMDVVIASVHSGFNQDEYTLTKRLIKAMENKHVNIIAHPTGRLLGKREPYKININDVFKKAIENNIVLEINASPDRLDLKDVHCREAKKMGIKMVINTDAHEKSNLYDMEFGVQNARRGWIEKKDIINTKSLKDLKQILSRKL